MSHGRILIIEDDQAITQAISIGLGGFGFEVSTAPTGKEGMRLALNASTDLVLLDLGLPDIDGLEVCAQIRAESQVPIIILTARGAEHEKIIALDGGADDYITKPFGMGELLARIRVALRRASRRGPASEQATRIEAVDLLIDLAAHQVWLRGQPVHLTPTEFKLLETLARNAGRMSTHRTLIREVWGPTYGTDTQLLRVFINQLRAKLEEDPNEPQYIVTEPGIGYRFCPAEQLQAASSAG